MKGLTVKSLSNTRWESRIKSVQAIRFQIVEVRAGLLELNNICDDAKSISEAESLANSIEKFEFLLGMVIWYDILFVINMVSKKLQSKSMCIDSAMKQLEGVISFFDKYRNDGYAASLTIAKNLALDMNIEPIFTIKRRIFRKRQFNEREDDEVSLSLEESFRIDYFIVVVDMAIASLKCRFEQMKTFENIFGFLFDSKTLRTLVMMN